MQEQVKIAEKESGADSEEVFYPHHPETDVEPVIGESGEEMEFVTNSEEAIEELDESRSIIPLVFPLAGLGIVIVFEMCLFLYSLRHITETTFHKEL